MKSRPRDNRRADLGDDEPEATLEKVSVQMNGRKVSSGAIVWTPRINDLIADGELNPLIYLHRHLNGDWGDLSDEDKAENEYSVDKDLRLLSAYETPAGKIWIITEADRSATTILLPEEY